MTEEIVYRRAKRSPCPCTTDLNINATGLFFHTNGRCYAKFSIGNYNYAAAQSYCMHNASTSGTNAGRLATFNSGLDFLAAKYSFSLATGGAWIGIQWNGTNTDWWDDPNSPSCPPPFNKIEFAQDGNTSAIATSSMFPFASIGSDWHTISASQSVAQLTEFICEFGKIGILI